MTKKAIRTSSSKRTSLDREITSATFNEGTTKQSFNEDTDKQPDYDEFVMVSPPFSNSDAYMATSEVTRGLKIAGAVFTFFAVVVVPSVWWAASFNSSLNSVQGEVKDVKVKVDKLVESHIQQDGRLNSLDKSILQMHSEISQSAVNNSRK